MQHIAVIDDDPEVIDLLTKWLNDIISDCKVHPFTELEKALDGIATTDFDLVVSDVDMGSGSDKFGGVKIAKALDTRRTPLLVISGFSVQEGVFQALDAWDYLQKPIDEPDFKTEVKRALTYRKGLTGATEQVSDGSFPLVPELKINRRSRQAVQWKGERLHLPMSKIDIVEALAQRAGMPVKYKELFEFIASGKNIGNLRVRMSEIRDEFRTVEKDFDRIQAVPMNGYLWRTD
ncbi:MULTISPECIES: response regulator transcription factor [Polaromonas]|uniref:Response regulator transcription factor n=1 Tax=Polaromonas aquatica TaxID=332657 RepID=A0ABW1U0S9_9BURK